MLSMNHEFLFNVLMDNGIAFIRIGDRKEFILLDYKIRIADFEADNELKYSLNKNKYKDFIFSDGVIMPSFLKEIINGIVIDEKNSYIVL